MKRILLPVFTFLFALQAMASTGGRSAIVNDHLIKVLILSGKNNHEWKKTTPVLLRTFNQAKLFAVRITDNPDTLSYTSLKKFDLVISNRNTWPDNNQRMSSQWEGDFLRYVNEGGGVVSIHAGGSSFYEWADYHQIAIGRWGKGTHHGARTKGHVYGFDQSHPVTKGMGPFYIMDEIWEKTDICPGAKGIGSLSATDEKDGHQIDVPAVFVNQTGKGRCFFTTLGHDERAMLNTGFQTLLLRAAQWCSGRKVTLDVPFELRAVASPVKDQFTWLKTDTSVTLKNHSEVVWQFNFNNRFGKSYFHPLNVHHSDLSCVAPPDHPWHLGLWFSWKFINRVNYWEYLKEFSSPEKGFKSEGVTGIADKKITLNPDFSSDIGLNLTYHPINGTDVLTEARNLHVSNPMADGSYYIDEEHLFKALSDSVLLDRTPISGEPGGQSWGGYGGLSIRFNQDYTSPVVVSPLDSTHLRKGNWLYMGFNTVTGEKAGMSIHQYPEFIRPSTSWYVISDPNVPFYYYSPAVIFDHNILLRRGETLKLKYRIWMLPGVITKGQLQEKQDQYLNRLP